MAGFENLISIPRKIADDPECLRAFQQAMDARPETETIRDRDARYAMLGLIIHYGLNEDDDFRGKRTETQEYNIASEAFSMADALQAEREKVER